MFSVILSVIRPKRENASTITKKYIIRPCRWICSKKSRYATSLTCEIGRACHGCPKCRGPTLWHTEQSSIIRFASIASPNQLPVISTGCCNVYRHPSVVNVFDRTSSSFLMEYTIKTGSAEGIAPANANGYGQESMQPAMTVSVRRRQAQHNNKRTVGEDTSFDLASLSMFCRPRKKARSKTAAGNHRKRLGLCIPTAVFRPSGATGFDLRPNHLITIGKWLSKIMSKNGATNGTMMGRPCNEWHFCHQVFVASLAVRRNRPCWVALIRK